MKTANKTRLLNTTCAALMIALAIAGKPEISAAAGGGDVFQPINNVFEQVLTFMTGTFATTAATIAVGAVGYLALTSRVPWSWLFSIVVGVAFIFGGAQLVSSISGGIGN
ncbi:type VI secretion protein [Phyllobacterium brassicacearum]|uniref:Type VI secretion protein n=1 Tax=Phyllobacterium brassicacearum TaxID=314235 RepID=A0A2P7BA41_9HYPH|nr:TrbC/VirB2 family protein [Phyllobacterium brassicacearum]PSH63331.1 type VI secretion protein [Phyllobacterium brassicacearum]TDQ18180.1 type IV secretion system protein VirB2 [Phyllobacterium brassicacearum]